MHPCVDYRAAAPLGIWLVCPPCSFLVCVPSSALHKQTWCDREGAGRVPARKSGEKRHLLLVRSPRRKNSPSVEEQWRGRAAWTWRAQLPRAQEAAFLRVWTTGSNPRKNFPTAIRKGVSSEELLRSVTPVETEREGRTPEVLEGSSGRRPSPRSTPPRGMPSPGHVAQAQLLTFALQKNTVKMKLHSPLTPHAGINSKCTKDVKVTP